MNTVKLQALENFMAKLQQAIRTNSKELRIPMSEGNEICAAIGQILVENISLNQKLKDTEALIGASIKIDGGKFG